MTIDSRNKCIFYLKVSFSGKFIQDYNISIQIAFVAEGHVMQYLRHTLTCKFVDIEI